MSNLVYESDNMNVISDVDKNRNILYITINLLINGKIKAVNHFFNYEMKGDYFDLIDWNGWNVLYETIQSLGYGRDISRRDITNWIK